MVYSLNQCNSGRSGRMIYFRKNSIVWFGINSFTGPISKGRNCRGTRKRYQPVSPVPVWKMIPGYSSGKACFHTHSKDTNKKLLNKSLLLQLSNLKWLGRCSVLYTKCLFRASDMYIANLATVINT